MSHSNFFIDRAVDKNRDKKLSPIIRVLIVAITSIIYGVVAVLIAANFLEMRGVPLLGVAVIYSYGIIGGLAILMLVRIFTRSEDNKKMLLDVLDYDESPHAITNKEGQYLYVNKAWSSLFGETKTTSYSDISSIFTMPHRLQQQLQSLHMHEENSLNEPFVFLDQSKSLDKWLKLTLYTLPEWKDCRQWHIYDMTNKYKTEKQAYNNYDIFAQSVFLGLNSADKPMKDNSKGHSEQFQNVFMDAPLGMCIIEANLAISSYNLAFKKLAGDTKIDSAELLLLIPKNQHETLKQWIELTLNNGEQQVVSIEIDLVKNKGKIPVRIYAHSLGNGQLALYFIDLTEQKNLEQQFTQSQKMQGIGQLAGGIAHDFNNLLTAMIGFCDLLLLRHKAGDPSFSDIMQVKQNANRASNLVRQLLAFSRQQTLQAKVLDVTDVLSDLLHLMQRLIGANISLNIKHGQNLWAVKTDEGQLEQVLINLVVNARDAMGSNGRLDIITENYTNDTLESLNEDEYLPVGEWVAIHIKDTGTGIEPDVLSRIFEPFFSTKEIGAGTGLGLSTVHGIVHQTGGFLSVDSVVGEGTCFTIYLPRHNIDESNNANNKLEAKAIEKTEEKAEDLTGSAAILLVEDEDAVRTFSSRALSNKGYKIIDASNGEVAMEILEKDNISLELLLTDVIMPEMDGPTLAKHVRRLYPDVKIIFMSGYSEDRFKDEFGENTFFLQKPFTLQQLAKMVKNVLEGK